MAVLVEVGEAAGIDAGKVTKVLSSGMGAAEVREEIERAADIGIDSVPTIVVDGVPLVSGAAPADQLAAKLLRASSLQRV
jgi:predicted DsbA family dithiol-disulfide isomerase